MTSNINTNSATDSKNYSNDPLIETVLQRLPIETLDRLNSVARLDNRKVFIILLKTKLIICIPKLLLNKIIYVLF